MSVFRRKIRTKLKDGTVNSHRSKFFMISFYHGGTLIRESTRLTDKISAMAREVELRRSLDRGDDRIRQQRSAQITPAIEEFIAGLERLGRDDKYTYVAERRLCAMARHAGWMTIGDISMTSLETGRKSLLREKFAGKPRSAKTVNQYIDIAVQFAGWCVETERLAANPILRAWRATELPNTHFRRAATVDELEKLFAAASPARRLFYRFCVYHPLRRDTLNALKWEHLHLKDSPPWGETPPDRTKSRRREKFPVRPEIAVELLAIRGDAEDDDRVFEVPTIAQLRDDLAKAAVPFSDPNGLRRFDLHAFRKTAIGLMKAAGVPLEQASKILHHKDLGTTRRHYDADEVEAPLTDAVNKLPLIGGAS